MPVYRIESKDDPRLSVFRDLPRTRDRSADGRFIVEGRVLVQRLWESGLAVESIFTDDSHWELAVANSDPETPIYVAPKPLLEETIGFSFHRGLLACGIAQATCGLSEWLNELGDRPAMLVVLDQVVDQENMGGVIRNAAALGADGVLVGPASARPFSRRVLRVSMGAVLNLPPIHSSDLCRDMAQLRQHGFGIVATLLSPEAIELQQAQCPSRVALVFGNEGSGIDSAAWLAPEDQRVVIPMKRGVDSLNVASASAIVLHHFSATKPKQ